MMLRCCNFNFSTHAFSAQRKGSTTANVPKILRICIRWLCYTILPGKPGGKVCSLGQLVVTIIQSLLSRTLRNVNGRLCLLFSIQYQHPVRLLELMLLNLILRALIYRRSIPDTSNDPDNKMCKMCLSSA